MSKEVQTTIDNVNVTKAANVYFDGRCVSHSLLTADGKKLSVGVILPSQLKFETAAAEIMEIVAGQCRVKQRGETVWQEYGPQQSFNAPANSFFEIECTVPLHYVCHYA